MKSMTGYGRGAATKDGRESVVEISSLNRRNLELQFASPGDWPSLERHLSEHLRKEAGRGKVTVQIRVGGHAEGISSDWDQDYIRDRLQALRELVEAEQGRFEVSADIILQIIGDRPESGEELVEEEWSEPVEAAFAAACREWQAMRGEEGRRLQKDLTGRSRLLRQMLQQVKSLSEGTVPNYREKLLERLRQANLELDLSDERVLKEIALFADRCDISEEMTRLDSHFDQLEQTMEADGPVGRKLDFICQEIYRELNTIGSKAHNLEISRLVIESKNEWERLREQAANVE